VAGHFASAQVDKPFLESQSAWSKGAGESAA
jgi:hypothetical protein